MLYRPTVTDIGDRPPAWVERRKRSIGGSDAAAVMCVSPYKGPLALWAEKTGRGFGSGGPANQLRLRAGNFCEPLIRDEYQRLTGLEVLPGVEFAYHPDHPYMSANTDGLVMVAGSPVLWEAKTVSPRSYARHWGDGVPIWYEIQCQHYMAVLGYESAQLCAMIGFDRVRIYDVPRHDRFINDALIPAEAEFWDCVESDRPPRPDGSPESFRVLSRITGPPRPGARVELGPDADRVAAKLVELETANEHLANARRECRAQLLAAMGDHEHAATAAYRITRRKHGAGFTVKVEPTKNDQ